MNKRMRAASALQYIIPILEKYKFKWCISGGFACYLYGIKRPIVDIDIDVETDKNNPALKKFIQEVKPFTQLPFQHWKDRNFDHYVTDVVVDRQLLSIITTKDMKMFNRETGKYELFYKNSIPNPKVLDFESLQLPVLPEEWVIKLKQAFAYKSPRSERDIAAMYSLLGKTQI